jgi:Fe2+ or Zn2+ uptake regulation protein
MTSRADLMLADLKRAGLKLTPQRIAIVRELADDLTHPTAQALFNRLRPAFPTMSFATVYNTLDALTRCGLTEALNLGGAGGAIRFDPNTEPHHHAVCDLCGAVHDVPIERIDLGPLDRDNRSVIGFKVLREQRTYRGLCDRCSIPAPAGRTSDS